MNLNRRTFLSLSAAFAAEGRSATTNQPWYKRAHRWGQTNITEKDPVRYDIAFWRDYWKRTATQAVIINAGGIVAYYPSKYPLHHRAEFLNGRDLYGELAAAAHQDGIFVVARMDSNRTAADFYEAHPDWFARRSDGSPHRAEDKYVTCVNSPYYDEYLPGILREIIERSKPEGFADNSWAGLGRDHICYCDNCERKFRARSGKAIPRTASWDDPVYREWIMWNYDRRIEIWDLNNRTTKAAGGPDCIWIGMNSGSVSGQARSFRDLRRICERSEIVLLDHQRRDDATGFQDNGDTGKRIHGLLGWDKLAPESMAMYQAGKTSFRLSAKPAAEARMWMIDGFAGGIQPWWHHVGAYHEDKRAYDTAEPVMRWYKANEAYLGNRRPVASVGIVWSQRNTDFYGRKQADELVDLPYRGVMQALIRARIPYLPVNADHIGREKLSLLILPNVAALSDAQCDNIRKFVDGGGSLLATGAASQCNEWGEVRKDFALADVLGVHSSKLPGGSGSHHSYLRIEQRHPVLSGFEETAILPFGGMLEDLQVDAGATVPLTFIPPFPVFPPETSWMRTEKTSIPGLVLRTRGKSRIAYLAADIDRRFAKENLPDHGDLLRNLIRWASADETPLRVTGPGLIDCHLYRQDGRMVLHLVNLTSAGSWRSPIDELIPVGPLKVSVQVPRATSAKLLVAGGTAPVAIRQGWCSFEVKSVLDHEVAVIS